MSPSRDRNHARVLNHAKVNDAFIIIIIIILFKAIDSLSRDVDKISMFWKLLLSEVRKKENILRIQRNERNSETLLCYFPDNQSQPLLF